MIWLSKFLFLNFHISLKQEVQFTKDNNYFFVSNRLDSNGVNSLRASLYNLGNLSDLDLSFNDGIETGDVLQLLQELWSHNVPISRINIAGSSKVFSSTENDDFPRICDSLKKILDSSSSRLEELIVTCKNEECANQLSNIWSDHLGNSAKIVQTNQKWSFSKIISLWLFLYTYVLEKCFMF